MDDHTELSGIQVDLKKLGDLSGLSDLAIARRVLKLYPGIPLQRIWPSLEAAGHKKGGGGGRKDELEDRS